MPSKKDNLPVSVDVDLENGGTIKYANEVVAIIAGVAASEVEGIAGMCTSGGISDIIGRNRNNARNITRGVKVEIGSEEVSVELYIIVEYGSPIQKVAMEVQENVRKAVETMTGLHVINVDVHVQGVSFEKEKKVAQSVLESAHLTSEEVAKIERKEEIAQETQPQPEVSAEEKQEAPSAIEADMEAVEAEAAQGEATAEDTQENDAQ